MTAPGIHAMTAETYHQDPCDTPSLSASIASILCAQSPAHAWAAHPRLNPDYQRVSKQEFDLGTIVHQLFLEGHTDSLVTIDAPNYKTNAAKEARDEAYAAGRTPILVEHLPRVNAMVEAISRQLKAHKASPPLFTDGLPEQTLIWEEPGGVVCRSRLDWLRNDHTAIDDVKTTGRSANPEACSRALFGMGYDTKAAFYLRGLKAVTGADAEFRWCFVETHPPYALSVLSPGPDVLLIGAKKVRFAIDLWRECMTKGEWPGYTNRVAYAEMPGWEEERWLRQELEAAA